MEHFLLSIRINLFLFKYANNLETKIKKTIYEVIKDFVSFLKTIKSISTLSQNVNKNEYNKYNGKIISGGNQVIIAYNFQASPDHNLIFKLYNISLTELIMHCLSIEEYYDRNSSLTKKFMGIEIQTRIMNIYGIGVVHFNEKKYCYLIQEFNQYQPYYELIKENYLITIQLNKLLTEIAKNGFVIDPSPTNWFVELSSIEDYLTLDYIDLVFFNDPNLLHFSSEIAAKIENGEEFHPFYRFLYEIGS